MIPLNFIDMYSVDNFHATALEFQFFSYIFAAMKETKTIKTMKNMT